jgi:hypothetical protein
MSGASSSSIPAFLEGLRKNLRRWGELRGPAADALRRIRPVQERGRRLEFDISVDPGSESERTAQVRADLLTIEPSVRTVEEFAAVGRAIQQDARPGAAFAEQASIDAGDLLLFAEDLEFRHLEAARRVVERAIAKGTKAGGDAGKRGRRSHCDRQKDREIADGWVRARDAGTRKKDYAHDQKLSLKELNRILNRHAKRMRARK